MHIVSNSTGHGANSLVEQYVGSAYEQVNKVANNLASISKAANVVENIATIQADMTTLKAIEADLVAIKTSAANVAEIKAVNNALADIAVVNANAADIAAVAAVTNDVTKVAQAAHWFPLIAAKINNGIFKGDPGPKGDPGADGTNGVGIKGDPGIPGGKGNPGINGQDGKDGIDGVDGSPVVARDRVLLKTDLPTGAQGAKDGDWRLCYEDAHGYSYSAVGDVWVDLGRYLTEWKTAVTNVASLPTAGNSREDMRFATQEGTVSAWDEVTASWREIMDIKQMLINNAIVLAHRGL